MQRQSAGTRITSLRRGRHSVGKETWCFTSTETIRLIRDGERERERERQAGRQAGRQTGRQVGRQTETERQRPETDTQRAERERLRERFKPADAFYWS